MQLKTFSAGRVSPLGALLSACLLSQGALAQTSTTISAQSNPTAAVGVPVNPTDVVNATVFSYLYAIPLAAYAQLAIPLLETMGPNRISSGQALSGPDSQSVVRPNADTVYSTSIIDLSQNDLVLTVPNFTDGRFWVFPFYDLFGNNFASVSVTTGNPPGQYLIRRASDALVQPGIQMTQTATADCIPKYQGIISFPTTYGSLWNRILVRQNDTSDLSIVHGYQAAPALTAGLLQSNQTSNTAKLLDLLARLAPYNPPSVYSDTYRVVSTLGLAGLAGGKYTQPTGVNLTTIAAAVSSTSSVVTSTPKDTLVLGNGWYTGTSSISGNFGVEYGVRAYTANTGYLQLAEDVAVYPVYDTGPAGMELDEDEAYLFTFSGRPPIQSDGFWSLTLYGENQYFVPNNLSRYEIGDRSTQIKFEDGSMVYGTNASMRDGPFQVLLQPQDVTPPANWTSNWLPAPAGGGNISFTLRWYAPTPAFTNGSYIYPTVQKVAAIM